MKRLFITLGLLALLLSAAVLIWAQFKPVAEPSITRPLAELITTGEEFGWSHEDLPLGPTEAIAEASQDTLNLTDFLYRRYTKGPDSIDLYIGYWEPGRMPARKMNEHTPDTCWRNAGWHWAEKHDGETLGGRTQPGNWRWFVKSDARINVIFWHLVDKQIYQYGHQSLSRRLSQLIFDPLRYKLNMRREQFLIRISSPNSIDQYWETPLTQEVMQNLSFTGLLNEPAN